MPSLSIAVTLLVFVGLCLVALQAASLLYLRGLLRRTARGNRRRARQLRRLTKAARAHEREIGRTGQEMLAQVEALMDLYSLVVPRASMPSTQGWAAAPTTMQALLRTVIERRPALVVECGSGSSSVWLGYVLERFSGRCVSVEHDPHYAEASRSMLRTHGLEHVVEVRLAPLTPVRIGEEVYSWYDPAAIADLQGVGVVFVDGPPGAVGPLARFPALPMLKDRSTADVVFLLDDTTRSAETAILHRWTEEYGARLIAAGTSGTGWRSVGLPAPNSLPRAALASPTSVEPT